MIHLRLFVAAHAAGDVLDLLLDHPVVAHLAHMPGAARRPEGDVILCDVPRESASELVRDLRAIGLEHDGSITIEVLDTILSDSAREAERRAPGASGDAVLWESVRARAVESAEASYNFAWFMMLAALIAAIGILTDSIILVIGAMVLGPEFGPIAGLCLGLLERRKRIARQSLIALAVGFPLASLAAFAGTELFILAGIAPDAKPLAERVATIFIAEPDGFAVIVAALAGVAGMLSLTTNRGGALIGVFISVTTIPAAANMGVAAAYSDWGEFGGASLQLAVNLSAMVAAGLGTLRIEQLLYRRRYAKSHVPGGSWG